MSKIESTFDIRSETERLFIRPLRQADFTNWLNAFKSRIPSFHRHDKGQIKGHSLY
ncbi:hypothetical protein ACFFGV_14705 [Pontibacillus salicampi]|uniref:GNAT family N-acetyltransferase n=1 Tax=Pontibacillus salicampi TaxID=1449801 RepID=A0ABV6LQZ3_9BACI